MFKLTKGKIVIFAVLLLIVLAISYYFSVRPKETTVAPIPSTGVEYRDLTPGVSTQTEVKNKFGTPAKETQEGDVRTIEYRSKNPNFNNQFLIKQDTLSFIRTHVTLSDKVTITGIEKQYGENEKVLYGPGSINGFNLYVYPDKGFAYVGNREIDEVIEEWYFSPTDFDSFQALYAQEYSTNSNYSNHY